MIAKSKKGARVASEIKGALDTALSDGLISQDAYDRISVTVSKHKPTTFNWGTEEAPAPPPPEPELEPEPEPDSVAEPKPTPDAEPLQDLEGRDAVVADARVEEVAEDMRRTTVPEGAGEMDIAASPADRVEPFSCNETLAETAGQAASVQKTGLDDDEGKEKGFAFTTCFRCGRVDVIQYGDRSLPKEVRGECEVDNGIVVTLCGLCGKMVGGRDSIGSFRSDFTQLKVSPELFGGSVVQGIANAVLSQEVVFIMDEGGVAYRDVDQMTTSLGRDDKLMSVDVKRFKKGERIGLVSGFLAGGLIGRAKEREAEKREEEIDEWGGFGSSKKKNSLFGR